MVLPLYLAMTAAEISATLSLPERCAYMACHFSPYTEGLSNIPAGLPPQSMLILNDRMPCQGHSADLVASQLKTAVSQLNCESILLDFQRPPEPESLSIVKTIVLSLPCPVAVTAAYGEDLDCPVFLSPAPLHRSMRDYLEPWNHREIWLEAALCQEEIVITEAGIAHHPIFPTVPMSGGFSDGQLLCRYHTKTADNSLHFTLFDTPETLKQKLELAAALGAARAIGLWQELDVIR